MDVKPGRGARGGPGPRDLRGPTLVALLAVALGTAACQSAGVSHPRDLRLLIAQSPPAGDGPAGLPSSAVAAAEAPAPEPYRLGTGDVVHVSVPGQEEFLGLGETAGGKVLGVRVKEDGHVHLPRLGRVPAAGRTVLELQQEVQRRLQPLYPTAFVSVDVLEHRSQRYHVMGEVVAPGTFPVDGRVDLIEAVLKAGGPAPGEADLDSAYVVRDGGVLPVDVAKVLRGADPSGNVVMRDGDLVFVPHVRERKVYVLGEVRSPGIVPMDRDGRLTLAEAIAAAEGLDPVTAAQDQIRIFRGGWGAPRAYTISAHELYKYGTTIHLQPGDRVLVAPTGLATWGRALGLVGPFVGTTATALGVAGTVKVLSD